MGYTFDYLVAELPCGRCGETTPADESLDMTTALRDDPQLAFLGVGDALPADTAHAVAAGYLVLHEPAPDEPVVLLHRYTCRACGYAYNWAEVVVTGSTITAIRAVDLNQQSAAGAHFGVDDLRAIAADLAGVRSYVDLTDDEVRQILRERLPSTGGWHL